MKADLGKQLRFPEHIVETTLRPDIVLFSDPTGGPTGADRSLGGAHGRGQ